MISHGNLVHFAGGKTGPRSGYTYKDCKRLSSNFDADGEEAPMAKWLLKTSAELVWNAADKNRRKNSFHSFKAQSKGLDDYVQKRKSQTSAKLVSSSWALKTNKARCA